MHELPKLPYATNALEPHIDARTMEIHHGKHHQVYVDNLNKAVAQAPGLEAKAVEDLLRGFDSVPEASGTAVRPLPSSRSFVTSVAGAGTQAGFAAATGLVSVVAAQPAANAARAAMQIAFFII